MKYRNPKKIKKQWLCWFTAAMLFFCAVIPVRGLCVCSDCPYANPTANSTHSKQLIKNCAAPVCCTPVAKTTDSDDCSGDYCSCDCASPPPASVSVSNQSLLPDELKNSLPVAFFSSQPADEVIGQLVSASNILSSPISRLSVRLHILLSVMLN